MQVSITDAQLKVLQQHRGQVDAASGQRYVTIRAKLDLETLRYNGVIVLEDVTTENEEVVFDLNAIVAQVGPTSDNMVPGLSPQDFASSQGEASEPPAYEESSESSSDAAEPDSPSRRKRTRN